MSRLTSERSRALWVVAALALATTACGCAKDDGDDGPEGAGASGRGGDAGDRAGRGGSGGADGGDGGRGVGTGEAGARSGAGGGSAGEAGEDGSAGDGGMAGDPGGGDSGSDGGADGSPGACDPRAQEHAHDSQPAMHVPDPLPASSYNSSPPSSGPHCGQWGQYTVFAEPPLPACNFLHNLEHGAVALLYNCPDGCADLVTQLAQVVQDAPADPDCGSAKRLLLTPYSEMDATIAAAAWGYTFTADCLDEAARNALLDFIAAHLGSAGDAPEATVCANGSVAP